MGKQDFNKTLTGLRNLCSKREYCVSDIKEKALKSLEGDGLAAAEVVSALIKEGFLDNLRYGAAYARDKSTLSGWGRVKIRYNLMRKGLKDSEIEYALSQIDGDKAGARLEKLISNRMKILKGDPEWRSKLIRFALGRGYEYDDVSAALKSVQRTHKDE